MSGTDPRGVDQSLMTLRQAAEHTGLSATTFRRYIKSGRLRARLIPGRYGPEYVVGEDDLTAAGISDVPEAESTTVDSPAAHETVVAEPEKNSSLTMREASLPSGDAVPGLLYRELMMKHEHLLVQFGMLRASGQQLYDVRKEAESRAKEAREAADELRRIRDRHANEIGALKTKLRQAELKIAERNERIGALRRRLAQVEMRLRNAATANEIDNRFSRAVNEPIDRPSEAPGAGLSDH